MKNENDREYHSVQIGDTVHVWIEKENGLEPIPGIITFIHDEETADLVVFPGTGMNDLKLVMFVEQPEANCFTLRDKVQ